MNNKPRTHGNIFIGFIFILIGALFLVGKFGGHGFGDFIATWWPMILIIIGLKKMLTQGENRFGGGFIVLVIGIVLQLFTLDVLDWQHLGYLWPLILILLGLKLIFTPGYRGLSTGSSVTKDTIDTVAIFGGTDLSVTSSDFKGGQATALFGAVDIDLRDAKLSSGTATLHASAFFGGVDIKVPENWKVEMEGTPLFGALENKCKGPSAPDAPHFLIKGSAVFGGVEVKR